MRSAHQTLAEQLHITSSEIARRKELLGFGEREVAQLVSLKPMVALEAASIVEEFYQVQLSRPEIERLIGDAETLKRLKGHLTSYILKLFDGVYDQDYVQSRLRVGMVHNRIGVPSKIYVASVRSLMAILRRRILGALRAEDLARDFVAIQESLEKILLFDLTLVFDTYIHALVDQVERSRDETLLYAESLEEEVAKRTAELAELARRDPLTGLANQRALFDGLRREMARAARQGLPLTVAYMDMDRFKEVNDAYGHSEGDRVLQALATVFRTTLRPEDLPARIGGDEFCVMLTNTAPPVAHEVMKRLTASFDALKGPYEVNLSIGLAAVDPSREQSAEELIRQADAAMYKAKRIKGHAVVEAGVTPSGKGTAEGGQNSGRAGGRRKAEAAADAGTK